MDKYEYKVLNAKQHKELKFLWKNPDDYEKFLNEMGQDGWMFDKERDLGGVWTLIFRKKING